MYPFDPSRDRLLVQISLQGQVSQFWNGQSSTLITAEAPHQDGVESSAAVVNATFVYCTEVF